MKRLLFASTIIASTIFMAGATLRHTEEQPAVIKAVAPSTYPVAGIAKKMRAEGKVIVEVTINAKGDVTAEKFIEGHRLLKAVSIQAARQWKFAPGANERTVRLTFTFRVGDGDKQTISFIPPYEVEFIGTPGRIY